MQINFSGKSISDIALSATREWDNAIRTGELIKSPPNLGRFFHQQKLTTKGVTD